MINGKYGAGFEGKAETARNLKRLGVPAATIAEATGLPESAIAEL